MLHGACGIMRVSVVPVKADAFVWHRTLRRCSKLGLTEKQNRNFSWRWRYPRNGAARKSSWTLTGALCCPICLFPAIRDIRTIVFSENMTNEGFSLKGVLRSRKSRQQHKHHFPNVPTVKRSWQNFMRRKREAVAVGQVFNFLHMFKDFACATWQCLWKRRVCEQYTYHSRNTRTFFS